MALVVPDVGEAIALYYLTGKASTENLIYKLYTNNITPAETDVAGTYTEATGNGYSAKSLQGSNWATQSTNPTEITHAEQTWTFTGSLGSVYGYYVVRSSTADLVLAERFSDGPYNIANNGDQIKITPKITAT